MGKVVNQEAEALSRALKANPVVPAVRGPDSTLEAALAGEHTARTRM